jgi:hypothetical protein
VSLPLIVLDNTLSDEFANSYADVSYCDDYWANHFDQTKAAQWSALSETQKERLLIQACRILETARFTESSRMRDNYNLVYDRRSRLVVQLNDQIQPVKYYYYQRLQFPRNIDRDILTGDIFIPEPILMAQCEQSVYILNFDDTSMATRIQGVVNDSTQVDTIRLRQALVAGGSTFSPMALEYVRPFLLKANYQARRQ